MSQSSSLGNLDWNVNSFSYIYGAEIAFHDANSLNEFYAVAHKYNVQKALDFAKDVMIEKMNPENSITFFETAEDYDIPELKEACSKVL